MEIRLKEFGSSRIKNKLGGKIILDDVFALSSCSAEEAARDEDGLAPE